MTGSILELETHVSPSSPLYFGEGIETELPRYLERAEPDRCFLVTSPPLLQLFGGGLLARLRAAGIRCEAVLIGEGEARKSWAALRDLCEELVTRGATKDSLLLALGGGLIGNVAGFAAGVLYRGIRYVEIPTTVMAQTDGTLSNKQAINGARGKNQFGLYHAPLFVWTDCAYSRREPVRQIRAALSEAVKNAFILGEWEVRRCEHLLRRTAGPPGDDFRELLLAVIESKLAILRQDPSEKGYCVVLEYGHTFGHALEWLSGGALLHGEAVAIGMCLAARLSCELGLADEALLDQHELLLGELLGLPTETPAGGDPESILRTMLFDNKRNRHGLRFLLLEDFGRFARQDGGWAVEADVRAVLRVLSSGATPAQAGSRDRMRSPALLGRERA
jgi:3-dehydroquinate synthase